MCVEHEALPPQLHEHTPDTLSLGLSYDAAWGRDKTGYISVYGM